MMLLTGGRSMVGIEGASDIGCMPSLGVRRGREGIPVRADLAQPVVAGLTGLNRPGADGPYPPQAPRSAATRIG
ncbi:hypothetical protein HN018_22030 (plasmid) [Lichenicola cladoniae]|uniref:Uncharacterized protein n=1 Tax=Lichenicola cladoniae TaxID=1484109 RepID=A0A6M8HWD5_9PROT|nr:hypothetical protein [Lichenicola cladoniae]NPD69757.1 hypothetical protein [Acetobacteraceae bacterium]QKE92909.1 hypothetical protein HN018_22030 [Lichenicola cladoniae]